MSLTLPDSITTYFEVSNGADLARLTHCFAEHATVFDEKREHRGHEAIRLWLSETREKFEYRVEPLSAEQDGSCVTVIANVVGNFPGSPVQLDHRFRMAGDKIQSLEIR
ncbi:nuclear transport factor 2 family protein [Pseudomonas sp. X10]